MTPTPPDTDFGHFRENMVESWIVLEGQLSFLIEGEPLMTVTVGDVVQAPNERCHRTTSGAPDNTMRLAITPRYKEGQVHYRQPDSQGGDNQ
jgi:quercetin dioxygenase-like cupin family protein